MYLRTTKVKRPSGKIDEYIRLVESEWNDGSPRHRVICNLGRKELLAPHADALLRILKGEERPKRRTSHLTITRHPNNKDTLRLQHSIDLTQGSPKPQVGLDDRIAQRSIRERRPAMGSAVEDRIFVPVM